MSVKNKQRTVFYAEEGHKTFIDRLVKTINFKSESDAICYLIALGMQKHHEIARMTNEAEKMGN